VSAIDRKTSRNGAAPGRVLFAEKMSALADGVASAKGCLACGRLNGKLVGLRAAQVFRRAHLAESEAPGVWSLSPRPAQIERWLKQLRGRPADGPRAW